MSGPLLQAQFNAAADESFDRQMNEMSDLAVWFATNMQKIADGEVQSWKIREFAAETLIGGRAIYQRDLTRKGLEHG